jgi:hypothetical protein
MELGEAILAVDAGDRAASFEPPTSILARGADELSACHALPARRHSATSSLGHTAHPSAAPVRHGDRFIIAG